MTPQPNAPVQPVPVERAAGASHLHVSHDPCLVVTAEAEVRLGASEGPGPARHDVPVLPNHPTPGTPPMPPVRPPEQHVRQRLVEPVEDRFAYLGRIVMRPPPDDGVPATD